MKKQNVSLIIWFLAVVFAFSDCKKKAAENKQATLQTQIRPLEKLISKTSFFLQQTVIRNLD